MIIGLWAGRRVKNTEDYYVSWCIICFGSVWSKKITARGALWGMIAGFVGYIVPKILGGAGVTAIFNGFLDPFFIGLYLSVIFTIIGSIGQIKSQEEVDMQKSLHIFPKREMDDKEFKRTYLYANGIMVIGVLFTVFLLLFWALPYNGII